MYIFVIVDRFCCIHYFHSITVYCCVFTYIIHVKILTLICKTSLRINKEYSILLFVFTTNNHHIKMLLEPQIWQVYPGRCF